MKTRAAVLRQAGPPWEITPSTSSRSTSVSGSSEGYADLMEGRNLRGVLIHQH